MTIRNLLIGLIFLFGSDVQGQHQAPANPQASYEAKRLLNYFREVSGRYILSGQHNYNRSLSIYTERVHELTGKYPALWGSDFIIYETNNRQEVVDEAIKQHEQGAIITLMWHAMRPMDTLSSDFKLNWANSIQGKMSDEEWQELVTPGTPLHTRWLEQIDEVAEYLKVLRDKKIPVLWRPYHEMNGIWFWWGDKKGENGYKRLWINMYDRYVNHHQLHNLIWVWNANAPRDLPNDEAWAYADYFPGKEYVDVLAADVYHNDYRQSHQNELIRLGCGKYIALGEVGQMPTPATLEAQHVWCWFMTWAGYIDSHNTPEAVKLLYDDPRVITLDELPWNRHKE